MASLLSKKKSPEESQKTGTVAKADRIKEDRSHSRQTGALIRVSLLVLGDITAISGVAAASLAFCLASLSDSEGYSTRLATHIGFLLLYTTLVALFCHAQNLYSAYHRPLNFRQEVAAVAGAVTIASILMAASIYLTREQVVSREVVSLTIAGSFLAMVGWRACRRIVLRNAEPDGFICRNVVLIGTDHVADSVKSYLEQNRSVGLVVIGCLGGLNPVAESSPCIPRTELLGSIYELASVCRSNFIDEVIVCAQDHQTLSYVMAESRTLGVAVRVIPDFYQAMAWKSPIEHLGRFPSILLHGKPIPAASLRAKRVLDFTLALVSLMFLMPLLAAIAIWIKLDSEGPVFYTALRVGKKGRPLRCHKFRTMVSNADKLKAELQHLNERDGVLFKISKDPRITRAGRLLRKYSLDELPQLWNVLKGEMSIVGPRPPLASEVKDYKLEFLQRLQVPPGLTGLWQVEARRSPSFDLYIELDLKYVEQWSLMMDLNIIAKTFGVVLAGTGQ